MIRLFSYFKKKYYICFLNIIFLINNIKFKFKMLKKKY